MMEEQQHLDLEEPRSPVALALCSPSLSYCSSTRAADSDNACDPSADNTDLQFLINNLQSLISPDGDETFSDVLFYVSGRIVPLHRCILAVRCPFFKSLFAKNSTDLASLAPASKRLNKELSTSKRFNKELSKLKIDLGKLYNIWQDASKVRFEAFMTVVEFLYAGTQVVPAICCMDDDCLHEVCRPAVDFAIDMLGLTSVFDIPNLKTFWQNRLYSILEKAPVEEVFSVLKAVKVLGEESLLSTCLNLVAFSNIGIVDLEKRLPNALANQVLALRHSMGQLKPEDLNPTHEKECQRMRKALDSDDVELVHLLLQEGTVNLDQAHALHYAVSYCDPRTVKDIMNWGIADVNFRNDHGLTALHAAAMRSDPSILVTILFKGADPAETAPDGRTALQICSRLIRNTNKRFDRMTANVDKICFCMEILYQAEKKGLFDSATAIFPPTFDEKELFMRLVYLENRIAVARLLFPPQTKLVTESCHLESTSEFIGFGVSDLSKISKEDVKVDLNQIPSSPVMNEALLKRIDALQKSATIGRRLYPDIVAVLNTFTDDEDDLFERGIVQTGGTSEEQSRKKRRYHELKQALGNAFSNNTAAMERLKHNIM